MCHHVHVTLSAEERKEARKLAGIMIPVYVSVVLAVIAAVAVSGSSRQGELVASRAAPVAAR